MAHYKTSLCFSFFMMFCLSFSKAGMVPAVFVFGDSLVDVGNNNHLKISLAKADFPHNGVDFPTKKATGRFSNGKNSADFLADKLGVSSPPPYLSVLASKSNQSGGFTTGVSFASGGAGIFNGTDELFKQSIPLMKQVEYYSRVNQALVTNLGSAGAQTLLSKSLFAIVIGSNDIFSYFGSNSDARKKSTPQQYVDQMVITLKGQIKRMHDLGGRKFVVTGLGPVGCCPVQRIRNKTEECNEEVNYWAHKYNDGLKLMLQGMKLQLKDIYYTYFDTYTVLSNFINQPASYGFTEVKAACCGLGDLNAKVPCLPIAQYCSNRRDHVFWDLYHPTEAAASIFVDNIYDGPQQYAFPMNVRHLVAV